MVPLSHGVSRLSAACVLFRAHRWVCLDTSMGGRTLCLATAAARRFYLSSSERIAWISFAVLSSSQRNLSSLP